MKILLLLLCPLIVLAAPSVPDPKRFEPMDVFALEWGSDPNVSPNGRTVAYVRNGFDLLKDRQRGQIWLVDVGGAQQLPLTDGASYSPRWSPTGDRLAYFAATDKGVQLSMHWPGSGRDALLTQLTQAPRGLSWSPDGRWLAFTMTVPRPAEPMAKLPSAPKKAEWAEPAKVIQDFIYRQDGLGYLIEGDTQVFVIPADGGTPRQLTTGPFDHSSSLSWAVDGASLFVSANRHEERDLEPNNSEIYRVWLADGRLETLTDRYGPDYHPRVSPSGKYLAYLGGEDKLQGYQLSRLTVRDLQNDEERSLASDLDRNISHMVWDGSSRGLYIAYDDHGVGKVDYISLAGNRSARVENVGGESISRPYSGGSFDVANAVIAYTATSTDSPSDLAIVKGKGGRDKTRVLTALNDDLLAHKTLANVQVLPVSSSLDERKIDAWVATPPDFDPNKKYPLILEIHGGPFAAYGPHFSAEVQLYSEAGFVVVYANPRGSSSYGEEFGNLIHHAYPGDDYHDLMSVVDAAIAKGWVDPKRLFVTGGSGGGILTAWIVTQTPRFRAAVAAKPVINWISFVLTADSYNYFSRYWFPDMPWKIPQQYLARSPINFVDRVTTPTMLLTGENDYRTPISESEQFYQALKLRQVDTALVRFPDASHGIASRPSQLISKVAHVLAWFERYDKKASTETVSE